MTDDRAAGPAFLRDAASDLGGDLKVFLIAALLVVTGAAIGYVAAGGEGLIMGGLVGAGVFGLVVAWWALSWAWQTGRRVRDRIRR